MIPSRQVKQAPLLLKHIVSVLLLAFVISTHCQAGMMSSLLKAAKNIDTPDGVPKSLSDINFSQIDIDLPNRVQPEVLSLKLDLNNQWVLKDATGKIVSDLSALSHPICVIEKFNLPGDINQLKTFMPDLPLFVRSGANVYKLNREGTFSISAGSVSMRVDSNQLLQKAIYHLDRPWYSNRVHIVGASLKDNHLSSSFQSVEVKAVDMSPSRFRGQTLVIGGPIKGDQVLVAGESMSISELRALAQDYDISLILLDSPKAVSPDKLKKRMIEMSSAGNQTTGSLLSQFHQEGNKTFYQWNPDGKNYVFIQKNIAVERNTRAETDSVSSDLVQTILINSLLIYRPNEEHQKELDYRWVWWLPSNLSMYLVISTFAGFASFGTSRSLLRKIWRNKKRTDYSFILTFYWVKIVRFLLLFLLIIPLFGLPCLIFIIFYSVYLFFRAIFMGLLKFIRFFMPKAKNN